MHRLSLLPSFQSPPTSRASLSVNFSKQNHLNYRCPLSISMLNEKETHCILGCLGFWLASSIFKSMFKRPFNRIKKVERREENDPQEDKDQPRIENSSREKYSRAPNSSAEKPPPTDLKKKEETKDSEQKSGLASKPNLFKGKRETKLIPPPKPATTTPTNIEESNSDVPKPTPLVMKKRFNNLEPKRERESVVLADEKTVEQEIDLSEQLPAEAEDNPTKRKPQLKVKKYFERIPYTEKIPEIENSADYSMDQHMMQQQNYHLIQYREISINPSDGAPSEGKADRQRKRTQELKHLLNLEMDLYEPTLSLSSVTAYETYINKIKSGFVKNSADQSFDETTTNSCQTASFQYCDFMNQCPQDYSMDITHIERQSQEVIFAQFVLKLAPVVEELIQPAVSVTPPPIFLLSFKPIFKRFFKCPYPVFVYRSETFGLDILTMGERLYIVEGQIQSLLIIGKCIIGGLRNGQLVIWSGTNDPTSRLYQRIHEFTQTTNFELPAFCTHDLQRYSSYTSESSIVSLLREDSHCISSLDECGKLVRWNLQKNTLRGMGVVELRNLTQHEALLASSLSKRGDDHYVSTSTGLLCLHGHEIRQILQTNNMRIVNFEVPRKSPLVFVLCQDNSLRIYNENYSHPLLELYLQISFPISQIYLPILEHDNRQITILFTLYLIDTAGNIYEVKLLENQVEFISIVGKREDLNDKAVVFRGVSRFGEHLMKVCLKKDFTMASTLCTLGVDMGKSLSNLKAILEQNRALMTQLEDSVRIV